MNARVPSLSVIVPVRDGERYLGEALRSVPRDAQWSVEIVIVDDGSIDGTAEVVRSAGMPCVYRRHATPAGPATARNRGLAETCAPVVGFLDADDVWPPDKLAVQMAFLDGQPEVDAVLGTVQWIHRRPSDDRFVPVGAPVGGAQLGCGLYRRRLFERIGLFDATLPDSEDVDWLLRAQEGGARIARVPEVGLFYRHHAASMTYGVRTEALQLLPVLKRALDRRRRTGDGR